MLFCWSWTFPQLRSHSIGLLIITLLLGLLYLPQGQHGRFGNKLTLNRETRHIYVAVLGDSRKDTLYIHERPSQIVVLERGTISVRRASQELRKYQKNLSQDLTQKLVYLHQTNTDSTKDQQLLNNGDWLEEHSFIVTTRRELVVLRHRKIEEPD